MYRPSLFCDSFMCAGVGTDFFLSIASGLIGHSDLQIGLHMVCNLQKVVYTAMLCSKQVHKSKYRRPNKLRNYVCPRTVL